MIVLDNVLRLITFASVVLLAQGAAFIPPREPSLDVPSNFIIGGPELGVDVNELSIENCKKKF
ncbi:hypothetical protein Clacol_006152 [Clathrus columnatus]|uniref:Uncharacterized protein n=1 Tax=Clathrus columnatus TaxID=1419009 RepID=A0AAV5AFF2_9AGAM|nr:hypothetical protein Clacol_006152 [Clathrus columnatus]